VISAGLRLNWGKVWMMKEVRTEMKSATYVRFHDERLIYREGSKE
jgi:hypothetical protein